MPKKSRAQRREERILKERFAPRGGTRGAQVARAKVARGYAGLSKGLKKR
ncbi:MAG: hypothetical protein AAB416_01690 [Patescibacteria group bacterium]